MGNFYQLFTLRSHDGRTAHHPGCSTDSSSTADIKSGIPGPKSWLLILARTSLSILSKASRGDQSLMHGPGVVRRLQ